MVTVVAGGRERAYLVAPARRVVPGERPGLLIALTAAYTPVETTYAMHALDALRDHGLTVVLPVPYGAHWNAGACCGRPWRDGVDDVAAISVIRADAVERTGADPTRVALVGHSAGALMAWRMACTPLFEAAVVVEVSGTLVHSCPAPLSRLPRMLSLHGALDATVPLDGTSRVVSLLGIAPPSVRGAVATITTAAGCSFRGIGVVGVSTLREWHGCASGGTVRVQVVRGQGHSWPALQGTRRTSHFLAQTLGGVR
jgi:polyhydroxybutyrate depolymerase